MAAHQIIIAGFGGQGVLFLGEVLARAALHEGREVTWLPAYGPEQRGGTAHCTVVIDDEPIASPVVADPTVLIVMNRPSLDRFEAQVQPGGVIVCDTTVTGRLPARRDVTVIGVPATAIATHLGVPRAANIVLLGALLEVRPPCGLDAIRAALDEMVRDPQARAGNLEALERGRREASVSSAR
ncbi:MAG: 2-oxoacid:acceptor oxidoreductase family protein [Armatimonadota bacterium]|nr:2-oxoacid:acceptor oxidoreductase family protein [Armatimonadota bacterium]MDR7486473.1 2-oxoacid:acceptor oxidoreductase family protein [Armatimonadota bacterium]MDR7532239.1 2-oxoacid:acceptor oxidoreductase family protein [Armatimonadota bacterium]MDR7537186.1 2-oxoacid:acceptor oxidoreductase family protein [Armatimonadota bacterium]